MKVRDIMTAPVFTVREDATFKEIAQTLIEHDISAVPVQDADGYVIGVVTEADLIAKEAYPESSRRGFRTILRDVLAGRETKWAAKAQGLTANAVMTGWVATADPDEDLHVAARRMLERDVKRLVVIEDGRLAGIISRSDIVRIFGTSDHQLQLVVTRLLTRCGYVEPEHRISASVTDGVVTLDGTVLFESDIRVAGSIVAAREGVVGVKNELLYRLPDPDRHSIPR